MLKNLTDDHEILAASAEAVIQAADSTGDESTVDLAIQRQRMHQKHHWMLKAHLDEPPTLSLINMREESAI
jgi:DNA-binding ferritin-like protein